MAAERAEARPNLCSRSAPKHLACMVSPGSRPLERHEQIGGFAGLQRASQDVAQVHDHIDTAPSNISEDCFQCAQIPVNAGE
jgi:hypothetical protein